MKIVQFGELTLTFFLLRSWSEVISILFLVQESIYHEAVDRFNYGNGRVISATPTGNEIASWKLKWKWDDAGLWRKEPIRKVMYCSPGSLRFNCFDNIKENCEPQTLMKRIQVEAATLRITWMFWNGENLFMF